MYDEALARDPSLQFAINGRAAVAPRAELGNQLQTLIDRPERLATDEVRMQTERLLARARALPSQGPVIRSQVSRLELLLHVQSTVIWHSNTTTPPKSPSSAWATLRLPAPVGSRQDANGPGNAALS